MSDDQPTPDQLESLRAMNAWLHISSIANTDSPHATATNHNEFKMGGMAWLAAVLSACCVLIMFAALVMIGIEMQRQDRELDHLTNQLRDNQAWVGVYGNRISAVEGELKAKK